MCCYYIVCVVVYNIIMIIKCNVFILAVVSVFSLSLSICDDGFFVVVFSYDTYVCVLLCYVLCYYI